MTINGTWLQLPVLEQIQQQVGYGLKRWCLEKPYSLIVEALGVKHVDLDLTNSFEESD